MNEDIYFCGHCNREQRPSQGERCISCNRRTITMMYLWDSSSGRSKLESHASARERWQKLYGRLKPGE